MTEKRTSVKNLPKKNILSDDSALSHNFSKSVKYRLRVQQDKEAEDAIKEQLQQTEYNKGI